MTGTGTQADPYLVSTWEEFKTAVDTVNVYVALDPNATSKVMDANDANINPFSTSVRFQCDGIEGNGWTIRNLYFNGTGLSMISNAQTCTINNLYFENIVCNNGISSFLNAARATFNACRFTGIKYAGSQTAAIAAGSTTTSYRGKFSKCTFAFKVVGASAGSLFSGVDFTECNLNIISSAKATSGTRCDLFDHCTLENALILGGITLNGGGSIYMANASTVMKNVFAAVEINRPDGDTTVFYPGKATATSCIVKDLIGSGIAYYNGDNIQYVTAAQGKDAAYLSSIGFPVTEV